ncbi:hypothetical protein [Humibacter albus]|uniref:hypothetical protein n=1 Tax=Humibacter albus TaxID=427754 RepID=UPI0003B46E47|nr:hypothetical protein [Humibacter albus]
MTRTPRKPLWRWEPGPYLLLLLLLLATGTVKPERWPVLFDVLLVVTIAVAAGVIVLLVVQARSGPRNPDSFGVLRDLDGLRLLPVAPSDAPPTPVIGTQQHQSAIDSTRARAGGTPTAVLVPDATRWLGLRLRVAVHLVAVDRVYHVGFLPERAVARYNDGLRAPASRGEYVAVPARVNGETRPFRVELDLGSLAGVVDEAQAS